MTQEHDPNRKAEDERALIPSNPQAPTTLSLGPNGAIDVSSLTVDQQQALTMDYAKNRMEMQRKAEEAAINVRALDETLNSLTKNIQDVSKNGDAVTISHTQTTENGRSEILMGNTDKAKGGKLSKSQTGETDWTPYYIFAGIGATVLTVLVVASSR